MSARFAQVLAIILCCLCCSSEAFAKGVLSDEAQKHFDAGLAFAEDPGGPKWEEALREFLAAYAISPTWKLKNNVALCALQLERDGEALDAYKEYLAHGGEDDLSAKHRKQIERDVATLSASLVRVEISVNVGEAFIIDERRTSNGEVRVNRYAVKDGKASLGIHPGTHKVTVEAPGHSSHTWTFDAAPASAHQHRFELEPTSKVASNDVRPHKQSMRQDYTNVYIGLAATGAFAAAAAVTGVLALQKDSKFNETLDPEEEKRLEDSGKPLALVTDISIGAAILSAGITAYLYFSGAKAVVPTQTGKSLPTISPIAGRTGAGLAVVGSF